MGTDIHGFAEQRADDGTWHAVDYPGPWECPFDEHHYGIFGFLAGVRNIWNVPVLHPPRGFPDDASAVARADYDDGGYGEHNHSWLLVSELTAFDYDSVHLRTGQHGRHVPPPEPVPTPVRTTLGERFFVHLALLQALDEQRTTRIVFYFDS
ncbi:hypothetical protein [Umezawaea sp. NPDC059074]|uniref:hypothetical protein n=1 Tax=Umezawaea sp. NPDC059074 TaxID=3346716 RepID=UPI00368A8344